MNEFVDIYYENMKSHIRKLEGYTIYADESMNLRKVTLSQEVYEDLKFKHFVIGGIIVPKDVDLNLIKALYSKREGFPDNEVKYKYFAHNEGKIESALKFDRFFRLLNFLLENNIYIHLNINNFWYLGLADIIDSLLAEDYEYYMALEYKMALYEVMIQRYNEMYTILYKYNYPSIRNEDVVDFLNDLYNEVKIFASGNIHPGDEIYNGVMGLKTFLENKRDKINELVFIQDEDPLILFDSLLPIYMQTCTAFIENGICFDNEIFIEDKMNAISPNIVSDLKIDFVDSKDYFGVQISDVIAGFAARFFELLVDEERFGEFLENVKTGSIELRTMGLFRKLLFKSAMFYDLNYIKTMSTHEDNCICRILMMPDVFC